MAFNFAAELSFDDAGGLIRSKSGEFGFGVRLGIERAKGLVK